VGGEGDGRGVLLVVFLIGGEGRLRRGGGGGADEALRSVLRARGKEGAVGARLALHVEAEVEHTWGEEVLDGEDVVGRGEGRRHRDHGAGARIVVAECERESLIFLFENNIFGLVQRRIAAYLLAGPCLSRSIYTRIL
jgi:hypothetical protein